MVTASRAARAREVATHNAISVSNFQIASRGRGMRSAVLPTILSTLLRSNVPMMKDVTVCTGGACAKNGAGSLLAALSTVTAADDKILVKEMFCSQECPNGRAMCSPWKGRSPAEAMVCNDLESIMDSATAVLEKRGASEIDGVNELKDVFTHQFNAEQAANAGDDAAAVELYAAALAAVPPALLEPSQPPLDIEDLAWDSTSWLESEWSSDLKMSESTANYEYATCGDPSAPITLVDCTIDESDETAVRLSGYYEGGATGGGGGGGEFEVVMSEDGRTFKGTVTDDEDGEPREWSGKRQVARRLGERPGIKVRWLHGMLIQQSKCQLAVGQAVEAVKSATLATTLCCRTAAGWAALAEACAQAGDEEGAAAAKEEAEWLK